MHCTKSHQKLLHYYIRLSIQFFLQIHIVAREARKNRRKVTKVMTNDVTAPAQCTSTVFREPTLEIQNSNL